MKKPVVMLMWMLGAAAVAGVAAGCTAIRAGDRDLVREAMMPGLNTKAAVIRHLGGPDAISTLDDGRQVLTYGNAVVRGGGLGLSYCTVPLLSIRRNNRCGDTVQFTLAPDGKVTQVRVAANAARANGSIWPFSP